MNRRFVTLVALGAGSGLLAVVLLVAVTAAPASAGLLDGIATTFAATTGPLAARAAQWSSTIFYTIVFFEFAWSMVEGLRLHDWSSLLDHWVTRIVGYMVGIWFLQNQVALTQTLITTIGAIANDFAGAGGGAQLTPDGIAVLGWNDSMAMMQATSGNFAADIALVIPQSIAALFLQLGFIVVAVEDLCITLGVQFCIAVGGIAIGLIATRWSRPFAAVWPRMIFGTLLLLVAVNAVAAVGTLVSQNLAHLIAQMGGQPLSGILGDYVTIAASSIAYLLFALALPTLVGFLGATSPIRGGAYLVAAARSAGAMAAGGFAGGGAAAGVNAKTGIAQIEAATRTA